MPSMRELLDQSVYNQLRAMAAEGAATPPGDQQKKLTVTPPAGRRDRREPGSTASDRTGRQPGTEVVHQRGQERSVVPQQRRPIDRVVKQIDDLELRLLELTALTRQSPRPNAVHLLKIKHALTRDLDLIRSSLLGFRISSEDGRQERHQAFKRVSAAHDRLSRIAIPGSPRGQANYTAIRPPTPLPVSTPGPASPNYYQDPINSK